jgi:MFS family permease
MSYQLGGKTTLGKCVLPLFFIDLYYKYLLHSEIVGRNLKKGKQFMIADGQQRSGFKSILAINLFFMIGFITLRSSLTLFLKNHGYSADETYSLVTTATTLTAISALIWGYFSRFLPSQEELVAVGVGLTAIGYIAICVNSKPLVLVGLAMYVIGSSLYFVNINLLVNEQFLSTISRQQGNHLYVTIFNIGALIGLLGFAATHNIQATYIYAIISLCTTFIVTYFYKKLFTNKKSSNRNKRTAFFLIMWGLLLLSYLLLLYGAATRWLCIVLFVAAIAHVLYLSHKEKQRKYIGFIVMMLLCCSLYWLSTEIFYSQFTVFLTDNVNNTFGHITVLPLVYFIFDPIANIALGIFIYKFYEKHTVAPYKLLSVGVLFVSFAFASIVIPLHLYGVTNKISITWPILGIIMLGCSEFFLQSTLFSQVSHFASTSDKRGYFMGLLRYTNAFAASISFYLMVATAPNGNMHITNTQLDLKLYLFMMLLALFSSGIYFILCKYQLVEG